MAVKIRICSVASDAEEIENQAVVVSVFERGICRTVEIKPGQHSEMILNPETFVAVRGLITVDPA